MAEIGLELNQIKRISNEIKSLDHTLISGYFGHLDDVLEKLLVLVKEDDNIYGTVGRISRNANAISDRIGSSLKSLEEFIDVQLSEYENSEENAYQRISAVTERMTKLVGLDYSKVDIDSTPTRVAPIAGISASALGAAAGLTESQIEALKARAIAESEAQAKMIDSNVYPQPEPNEKGIDVSDISTKTPTFENQEIPTLGKITEQTSGAGSNDGNVSGNNLETPTDGGLPSSQPSDAKNDFESVGPWLERDRETGYIYNTLGGYQEGKFLMDDSMIHRRRNGIDGFVPNGIIADVNDVLTAQDSEINDLLGKNLIVDDGHFQYVTTKTGLKVVTGIYDNNGNLYSDGNPLGVFDMDGVFIQKPGSNIPGVGAPVEPLNNIPVDNISSTPPISSAKGATSTPTSEPFPKTTPGTPTPGPVSYNEIGTTRIGDKIVNKGIVMGNVKPDGTVVNNQGIITGRITPDGRMVSKNGETLGRFGPTGKFMSGSQEQPISSAKGATGTPTPSVNPTPASSNVNMNSAIPNRDKIEAAIKTIKDNGNVKIDYSQINSMFR